LSIRWHLVLAKISPCLQMKTLGTPVPAANYVFYNAPVDGIDNIFAWDASTGNRYQVTQSRYGAYNPEVSTDGKYLYYNEQGRDGFDIVRTVLNTTDWKQPEAFKRR
jgi:Tol biopolymer transport system component